MVKKQILIPIKSHQQVFSPLRGLKLNQMTLASILWFDYCTKVFLLFPSFESKQISGILATSAYYCLCHIGNVSVFHHFVKFSHHLDLSWVAIFLGFKHEIKKRQSWKKIFKRTPSEKSKGLKRGSSVENGDSETAEYEEMIDNIPTHELDLIHFIIGHGILRRELR